MTNRVPLRPIRPRVLVLASVALGLALAGCSGGGSSDSDSSATPTSGSTASGQDEPAPAALTAAWTASGQRTAPAVVNDDLVVYADKTTVVALDRATGEQVSRWSTASAGGGRICTASAQLGKGRMLGLLLQSKGHPCTIATAVDVRTGKAGWRVQLTTGAPDVKPGERDPYFQGERVAVGDRVLLATMNCDDVRRLSLVDGRQLATIAPDDLACRNKTVTDGQRVAVLDYDVKDVAYTDPTGTGFIPATDGTAAVEMYDADSGRRLWQHRVPDHNSAMVSQLLSTEPVVLTTGVHGRSTTRIWSDDGTPGAYLGKSTPFSTVTEDEVDVVGRTGDLLVARYPDSPDPQLIHGYDLTTGAERWQLLPPGAVDGSTPTQASVVGDRLIVAVPGGTGADLLGYDVADPATPEVLGRVDGMLQDLDGALALATTDNSTDHPTLAAYAVPASGEERDHRAADRDLGWTADDVRPEDALEACEAVTDQTLASARLGWGGLPTPSDCTWVRNDQPDYVSRTLSVTVEVGEPSLAPSSEGDSKQDGAVRAAQDLADADRTLHTLGNDDVSLDPLSSGTHLGDEAWGRFAPSNSTTTDPVPVKMVTRWRNVVVTVEADQSVRVPYLAPAAIPYDRLQDVVYDATADVLEKLGDTTAMPARGADGPVGAVGSVCAAVDPVATSVLPVKRTDDSRFGSQQQSCVWTTGKDDLLDIVVVADAVPGAPDGTSAVDRATQLAAVVSATKKPEAKIAGLPGLSTLRRYVSDDGDYLVWQATSRVDNLVVTVEYGSEDLGQTRAQAEAATGRLMRTAVAAAQAQS